MRFLRAKNQEPKIKNQEKIHQPTTNNQLLISKHCFTPIISQEKEKEPELG